MEQQTANWDHCLQYAARSDVGLRRGNNQDAMAVMLADSQKTWQQRGHLFMVADGMGAHAAGELASKLATDSVTLSYAKLTNLSPPEALLSALVETNAHIHGRGQADEEFRGMGTTSTALLLLPQGVVVGHVGDSRAYRLRGNRFEQLTFDHSLVWEMQAAGQLNDAETANNIPKNIITRSLGPSPVVQVDLEGPLPVAEGDTFLLCSDGLSGPVGDEEMGAILAAMDPQEAVDALVNLANLRGGPDNITVIVARVTGPELAKSGNSHNAAFARPKNARPVHPGVWAALGICCLSAAGAATLEYWIAAAALALGAAIAAVAAVAMRRGGESDVRLDGQPLGRGPYVACKGEPNGDFVERLHQLVAELRGAAQHENWQVDWDRFNAYSAQADQARSGQRLAVAIREYFQAIGFMMGQLKQQRRPPPSDNARPDSDSVLG